MNDNTDELDELRATIDDQQAEIDDLKARVDALEGGSVGEVAETDDGSRWDWDGTDRFHEHVLESLTVGKTYTGIQIRRKYETAGIADPKKTKRRAELLTKQSPYFRPSRGKFTFAGETDE